MPDFIPGLELNRRFYKQVVRPILDREFPGLRYAAARIGYGSDVLGFLGRTADVGDEVGTRLVAARLVHDMMRLSFLQERVYAPYSKWFGSAFKQLRSADSLMPLFESMLRADTRETREPAFVNALEQIADSHNALNLTTPLRTTVVPFFTRPYRVLFAGRFADALIAQIRTPEVRRIAERTRIGGVNQFTTNSDFLESVEMRGRLQGVFEGW